jgi:ABC-type transport system involved in multi-copper enzyme maturation permease subunit
MRVIPDNPVLTKEMRVRMRGARAYWILLGYLGFLSLVLLLNYLGWLQSVQNRGVGASDASRIGASIFQWVMVTQVFLVLFITPAITSGSLTIEKEQRTLDMLTMTRLPRRSIIAGKLLSAVLFTALLLVTSLPLVSICFMLGSVDPAMVVSSYMMLLMGSFLIGAMGLMWSSIAKSTSAAVLYTYATLVVPVFFGFATYAITITPFRGGDVSSNLLLAVGDSWFGTHFLGWQVVSGFGFAVFSILGGLLLAAIAMSNLESWPERRAPLLRGLTLLFVGIQLLSVYRWWLQSWYNRGAQAIQAQVQPPLSVLILTAIFLMLLVPIFATGDLRPGEARDFSRYLAGGWSPLGLRRGRMASGLPFLLLLTMFVLGLYAFCFVVIGKTADIGQSGAPAYAGVTLTTKNMPMFYTPPTNSPTSGALQKKTTDPLSGDFPQAIIVLLAFVAGFSLLCMLLSIAFRNRWVALCLAYLFLLMIWIAPAIARSSLYSYNSDSPGPSINLYYFDPIQSLLQMNSFTGEYWNHRPLLLDHQPMWQVTTFIWLGVGVLSLALCLPFAARQDRRRVAGEPVKETSG